MTHTRFLKIALLAIAVSAFLVLFLPDEVWPSYVDIMEPISLLAGSFLALQVSFCYRKELKAAFTFLSVFLLLYALAIILFLSFNPLFVPFLRGYLGDDEIVAVVQSVQFIDYAMLFLFCINILKVINVTKLNKKGWGILSASATYSVLLAVYPLLPPISQLWHRAALDGPHIAIRILDAALIIVLTPVLWLYIQYLKSQQRQSLTFTVVILGITFFTLFDYLFQMITEAFPGLIPAGSALNATIPEALFIYGYLTIAVGLYAHRRDDIWGCQAIDKAMCGELKLVELDETRH